MNAVLVLTLLSVWEVQFTLAASKIDCSFGGKGEPTRCGYRPGWDRMMRANWKVADVSRDKKITDPSGYFAYFEARRRPRDFAAKFISRVGQFYDDDCLSFSYVNKGKRAAYPEGRSKLEVYFSRGGRDVEKADLPIWTSVKRTRQNKWKKVNIHLTKESYGASSVGSVVFVAVRGGSKRAYIAIDDIAVEKCKGSESTRHANLSRPGETKHHRALAARRPSVRTREFTVGDGLRSPPPVSRTSGRESRRSRNKRKRRRNKKIQKKIGVVYFPPVLGSNGTGDSVQPFAPAVLGHERPRAACNFMTYTTELQRCLRAFFSMLRRHKSKRKCNSDYYILESCLKQAATKCVPANEMSREDVHETITDILKNKFKTQKVYCLEEGAFVYPEFSLGSIPLQCSRVYFAKLTACGGAFADIFNFKHGDPSLCREYFQANECQRRTTAVECSFDARSKLVYGLNLQYQFAHNPFCIDLPFSAWWPNE